MSKIALCSASLIEPPIRGGWAPDQVIAGEGLVGPAALLAAFALAVQDGDGHKQHRRAHSSLTARVTDLKRKLAPELVERPRAGPVSSS